MEQAADLTYATYLRLPGLLDQQVRKGPPEAHDELLFIAVHQAYELWFKVLLHELSDARDWMLVGETRPPRERLRRCHEIERVLVGQLDVLDTMAPRDFLGFRDSLGSASGFQSAQYREVEYLSGLHDEEWLARAGWLEKDDRARLERRLAEPTVWDGFVSLLERAGFDADTRERRVAACAEIARDRERHGDLWELADGLLRHDQLWSLWRTRHLLTVSRQIGSKPGTAGSTGTGYLGGRVGARFFPELWEAPGELDRPGGGQDDGTSHART
ncbi:tryptophan 2,3-dioxygenase family protein [Streptomyces sp. B1866]|uniref:tryptophan 2,3-dioxygenase n=1 Tax=Streptomyces sp. B1866 TaxID=3075431 RepID=UPI002890F55E|nr:tryptophan 2,3-dioxygenase family protein [Streptomyces sp. B1866]MDT3397230.1 tryptophan 2,3-dioxygenase family protein [Streptomyces sp. B1866]